MASKKKKKQTRFPADDVDPAEVEALAAECTERVKEMAATVKLATVCRDVVESGRQMLRLGILAADLASQVKKRAHDLG